MAATTNRKARFWSKVLVTPGDCWVWQGATFVDGYGKFWDGEKQVKAHRWVMGMPEQCVLHTCDNPLCVNPEHLFLGTRGDNNTDCFVKGRNARGFRLPQTKLSDEQVREIRRSPVSGRQLALRLGVSRSHITSIRRGEKRGHVI